MLNITTMLTPEIKDKVLVDLLSTNSPSWNIDYRSSLGHFNVAKLMIFSNCRSDLTFKT